MFWELIGKLFAAYILAKVLYFLWQNLRSYFFPLLGWRINCKSYGDWAVVTGATDGIGKAYAMELARLGLNIVLVSRTQERLDNVAEEIREKFKVETKTVAFDFSASTGYEKIEDEISGLNIGVLVNNVGMGYGGPDYFDSVSAKIIENLINVNMLSVVKMSHMVLKGMLERKKGILIHISSGTADRPTPLATVYSASKAFVDFFAQAIQFEYRDKGIISQSIVPYFVETKLSGVKASLFAPSPTPYVKQALGTVGIMDRSHGYIMHTLQAFMLSLVPLCIAEKKIKEFLLKVRARKLKERAKAD